MTRIFVRRAPIGGWIGRCPDALKNLTGWDVSVETPNRVFCKKRTVGFMQAIYAAAGYATKFPHAEVTLPQDMKNVQVVG